jgi:hypothetical protein
MLCFKKFYALQFKHNVLISKFCTHNCHVSSFLSNMFHTFLTFVIHVFFKHMFIFFFMSYSKGMFTLITLFHLEYE